MKARVYVSLRIIDESCLPEEITKEIGILPSVSWHKGDIRSKTQLQEKDNGWELKSTLPEESSLAEHVNYLLELIEPAQSHLEEATRKYDSLLACAIYFDEETPEIHFDRDVIQRLSALNLSLDIDLYCLDKA
jgi:Domain of unknown function (DUF4279)